MYRSTQPSGFDALMLFLAVVAPIVIVVLILAGVIPIG